MRLQVARINIEGIKPSQLANAGLLVATLKSRGQVVIDVNMVVQVQRSGDTLQRVIFNPLD
jgi:hypothetical protein